MSYGKDAYKRRQNLPVKNQVYCPRANRPKLQFASESSANRHLSFLDPDDFPRGDVPIRSYHCSGCGAWHVTSKPKKYYEKNFEVLPEFADLVGV